MQWRRDACRSAIPDVVDGATTWNCRDRMETTGIPLSVTVTASGRARMPPDGDTAVVKLAQSNLTKGSQSRGSHADGPIPRFA
ncbi:hypothetical protein GCM10023114_42300 [Mycolicibacterium sediminis]|uniref:Uncharacterized protein n=1 Tax=Mycolicibacterium sediminis TaxID=1286180 RepID=A0A7I7QW79_9MYCO|nr:hypothetical protein MSEDJ_42620 [Mycolicibacterium sediminis]